MPFTSSGPRLKTVRFQLCCVLLLCTPCHAFVLIVNNRLGVPFVCVVQIRHGQPYHLRTLRRRDGATCTRRIWYSHREGSVRNCHQGKTVTFVIAEAGHVIMCLRGGDGLRIKFHRRKTDMQYLTCSEKPPVPTTGHKPEFVQHAW